MASEGATSELMWVEKYRPSRLEEMVNQEVIVVSLSALLKSPGNMPHLLFAGPPGTGKTTAALCVAKKALGEYWRDMTLELNASDERGIKMVRERVKTFARYVDRRPGAPFRIIILDEADEMTNDAQTALRRIMEESSRICRFILVCNYSSGIIEPIQSRCTIFRFSRFEEKDVITHLMKLCREEGAKCQEDALRVIFRVTNGDLRHAINLLQACAVAGGVDEEGVRRMAGLSGRGRVGETIRLALQGSFREAREKLLELTHVYGMSESDFLRYANDEIMKLNLPNMSDIIEAMAKYDYRLVVGSHPEIQLTALLAELGRLGREGGGGEVGKA